MTELKSILIERDGMTPKEADEAIRKAKLRVAQGENPEEILYDEFGLEPDYIFDLF